MCTATYVTERLLSANTEVGSTVAMQFSTRIL